MDVIAAVVVVTLTGLVGGAILVVASQFLKVKVDEREERVLAVLPGANCGACGFAGCADYAGGIVDGAATNLCIPGGAAAAQAAAEIMGASASEVKQQKAIVACQGSLEHTSYKYDYRGIDSCAASAALHGGSSACPYGCLGYGDCTRACKFGAIEVQKGLARVNPEKCTGCGACEAACPKKVIWIREVSEKPVVMCANRHRGAQTRKECTAGCIGCKKCEQSCPEKAITVRENVARIDLDRCVGCRICVNVCPVKAIAVPKVV